YPAGAATSTTGVVVVVRSRFTRPTRETLPSGTAGTRTFESMTSNGGGGAWLVCSAGPTAASSTARPPREAVCRRVDDLAPDAAPVGLTAEIPPPQVSVSASVPRSASRQDRHRTPPPPSGIGRL